MPNNPSPSAHLDLHFANLCVQLHGSPHPELHRLASKLSAALADGHSCISLLEEGDSTLPATLRSSPVVGSPGSFTPLILDSANRLYLQRYWQYENLIAHSIRARLSAPPPPFNPSTLSQNLEELLPSSNPRTQAQRDAATAAIKNWFTVITGGPGTGKTRTIVVILSLLHSQFALSPSSPRISLIAPTGKAAARMKESITASLASLPNSQELIQSLPSQASTIHRFLGYISNSPSFRHHAANPVHSDLVIVDEASMIDLALLAKLLDAIPHSTRLVLLGDQDQLASVEAGYVLGDICTPTPNSTLPTSHIIRLRENFRFGSHSSIHHLSQLINQGQADLACSFLEKNLDPEISWNPHISPSTLPAALHDLVLTGFSPYLSASTPQSALALLNNFRILAALRLGTFGVAGLNSAVERILSKANLINPSTTHYHGRPILIQRNDRPLNLSNGDVGIILPDPAANHELRAFFPTENGGVRAILPARLPEHDTAFALTVHKSQGSEFLSTLLILPDQPNPVVTRELLYTGITRAREHLILWAHPPVIRAAITQPTSRPSGLRDALWPQSP